MLLLDCPFVMVVVPTNKLNELGVLTSKDELKRSYVPIFQTVEPISIWLLKVPKVRLVTLNLVYALLRDKIALPFMVTSPKVRVARLLLVPPVNVLIKVAVLPAEPAKVIEPIPPVLLMPRLFPLEIATAPLLTIVPPE